MDLSHSWPIWLAYALAAFFCINGIVNVIGPKGMREGFARWGFPSWFHIANGRIQLLAGLLLIAEATRFLGLALGVLVCLGVFVTLIRHSEFSHLPPGIVLLFFILMDVWGLVS